MRQLRAFPNELRSVVDPRLMQRLIQIYELIYQLQDSQQQVPQQTALVFQQQLQQAGLVDVFGVPIIGLLTPPDPQLTQLSVSPGSGTVTEVTASSAASGFGLAATPSPIISTGNIAFSVTNAATARATLGITEFLLATVILDLNTNTKQTLYTVPPGKTCAPLYLVLRSPSTDITGGATTNLRFGFNAGATDWSSGAILDLTISVLTGATKFLLLDQWTAGGESRSSVLGAAGAVFGAITDAAFGSAATVVVECYGHEF